MQLATISQEVAPVNDLDRVGELVSMFLASQDVANSSRLLYKRTLKQYFSWIEQRGYALSEVARAHVLEYKESLLAKGLSPLSVGSYVTSVRRFYEWTEANKFYPNIAKGIRAPRRKQEYRKQPLAAAQGTELLAQFSKQSPRDFAIVNLLLRTGLRTIEVTRATVEDIVFKGSQRVLLVHGKGRASKDDFVVLTEKAYTPIAEYLATRGRVTPESPLFCSESNNNPGGILTTRAVSRLVKEGLKAIGLNDKAYTAHSLRHTAVVNCRRAGGSLEQAQALARHSSPATTQIYDSVFREEQRLANSAEALLDKMY